MTKRKDYKTIEIQNEGTIRIQNYKKTLIDLTNFTYTTNESSAVDAANPTQRTMADALTGRTLGRIRTTSHSRVGRVTLCRIRTLCHSKAGSALHCQIRIIHPKVGSRRPCRIWTIHHPQIGSFVYRTTPTTRGKWGRGGPLDWHLTKIEKVNKSELSMAFNSQIQDTF